MRWYSPVVCLIKTPNSDICCCIVAFVRLICIGRGYIYLIIINKENVLWINDIVNAIIEVIICLFLPPILHSVCMRIFVWELLQSNSVNDREGKPFSFLFYGSLSCFLFCFFVCSCLGAEKGRMLVYHDLRILLLSSCTPLFFFILNLRLKYIFGHYLIFRIYFDHLSLKRFVLVFYLSNVIQNYPFRHVYF